MKKMKKNYPATDISVVMLVGVDECCWCREAYYYCNNSLDTLQKKASSVPPKLNKQCQHMNCAYPAEHFAMPEPLNMSIGVPELFKTFKSTWLYDI